MIDRWFLSICYNQIKDTFWKKWNVNTINTFDLRQLIYEVMNYLLCTESGTTAAPSPSLHLFVCTRTKFLSKHPFNSFPDISRMRSNKFKTLVVHSKIWFRRSLSLFQVVYYFSTWLFSRELLRSRSSWVALLEEKIRWNRKKDCANWLVSCSFVLFLARVRIVLLTNHQFQIEKYVNFGYFVKWKMEMNTLTLTMSAHGYITYRCLGWLTMKTKCTHGW